MKRKILAISSGGGHWVEMKRLFPVFDGLDVAFASVYPEYALEVPGRDYYHFQDFSRFKKRASFVSAFQIISIVRKVRPEVIITTGSAPCLVALAFGRFFLGSSTIWIDSIANVEKLSTSGRVAKFVAGKWLTQWKDLAKPSGPEYWGAVL